MTKQNANFDATAGKFLRRHTYMTVFKCIVTYKYNFVYVFINISKVIRNNKPNV